MESSGWIAPILEPRDGPRRDGRCPNLERQGALEMGEMPIATIRPSIVLPRNDHTFAIVFERQHLRASMRNARCMALAAIGMLAGVAIGALTESSSWSLAGGCSEEVVKRQPSPDGVIEARVVLVNCGATSDFVTVVAVRSPSDTRAVEEDYFFSVKGSGEVRVRWRDDRRLVVSAWPGAQTFRKAILWGGLPIDYE